MQIGASNTCKGRPIPRTKEKGFFSSPVVQVDDFVEEKCSARGSRESRADQLGPVGQEGIALRTREESTAADVLQVNATHIGSVE